MARYRGAAEKRSGGDSGLSRVNYPRALSSCFSRAPLQIHQLEAGRSLWDNISQPLRLLSPLRASAVPAYRGAGPWGRCPL